MEYKRRGKKLDNRLNVTFCYVRNDLMSRMIKSEN